MKQSAYTNISTSKMLLSMFLFDVVKLLWTEDWVPGGERRYLLENTTLNRSKELKDDLWKREKLKIFLEKWFHLKAEECNYFYSTPLTERKKKQEIKEEEQIEAW